LAGVNQPSLGLQANRLFSIALLLSGGISLYLTDYSTGTEYQTLIVKEGNITGFYRDASLIFLPRKEKGWSLTPPFFKRITL
jgi:hypothetical protein